MSRSLSLILLMSFAALAVLALATPVHAELRCGEAIAVEGLNRLLGTIWGYLTGPLGKVIAVMLAAFGIYEMVFQRNMGAGVTGLLAAAVIAFAGEAIGTLFTSIGTKPC
jgi:type IV secretory pathway VirB2 component (pilin)